VTLQPISRTLSYLDTNGEERRVPEADLATQTPPMIVLGGPGMGKTRLMAALGAGPGHHYVTARKFLRTINSDRFGGVGCDLGDRRPGRTRRAPPPPSGNAAGGWSEPVPVSG